MVTTTIQSVANACCSANGYLHKMSRLDKNCSKQLLSKKACPERYSHYKQPDSAAILKKCDGQPLALVTIGEFLQANGWPTGPNCEDLCNRLHYHLENDKHLKGCGECWSATTLVYLAMLSRPAYYILVCSHLIIQSGGKVC